MDWPKFLLENGPVIIAVALSMVALLWFAWALIYSAGYQAGHRRGWRYGYRRGWRKGRQFEAELQCEESVIPMWSEGVRGALAGKERA